MSTEPAKPNGSSAEDEDLFDFPRMEWTLEGLRDTSFVGSTATSVPPPAPTLSTVAAPLPNKAPTTLLGGGGPTTESAPALKHVTPAPGPATTPIASPPADVPSPRRSRVGILVGALLVLFLMNGAGFWYLWRTRVSFGAGIEDLRTELDDAARRLERARREAALHGTALSADAEQIELERVSAIERSSLAMAENELYGGEYAAARVRLNKLLAQADRMNSSLRAEIEPRATFLIAKSYLDEARARQEEHE